MHDMRNVIPPGTMPVKGGGLGGILNYLILKDKRVVYPRFMTPDEIASSDGFKSVIWENIFETEPQIIRREKAMYGELEDLYDLAKDNYAENKNLITGSSKFKKEPTVVICGAGPSLQNDIPFVESHRDKACVITLNTAQTHITGDYFFHCEPRDNVKLFGWDIKNPEKTHAVLDVASHGSITKLPWKKISWFSQNYDFEEGYDIPKYHHGRHVTFAALQFVIRELKAKKVIFTGMDYNQIIDGRNVKYLDAILIQSLSFFASRLPEVEVWNCSNKGIFTNGVLVGKMSEALVVN